MACSHAPGTGASCNHTVVASNRFVPPAANRYGPADSSGADATADMRDGDADSGAMAPAMPQTTVPGSAASEAMRGGGTP